MAAKTRKISTLIESQLPGFISSEYENFSKFVEKYYEQLELRGQPLDILSNITKYRDINFYEKNLLNQKTVLSQSIANNSTTITVEDASSFPEENGYIRIGEEICFYKERTNTQFLEVSRGVSGNNTLGDLYTSSEFVTTQAAPHYTGDEVFNISNLFLYAFVKNFESEYLGAFPEKYLKNDVDKRTLIKNIGDFYRAKGTDRSIKFIFNSIISKDPTEQVSVYNPKDFTLKASTSDWVNKYALKVKVISGDVNSLVGNTITQALDDFDKTITFASAVVDNVSFVGKVNEENIYEVVLEPSTINGSFKVAGKTTLRTNIAPTDGPGKRIDVFSTQGFPKQGKIQIGSEIFEYKEKNLNQFVLSERSAQQLHTEGQTVYSFSTIEGAGVTLVTLGIMYNLLPKEGKPYSESGDAIQVESSGFETRHPVIYNQQLDSVRWLINTDFDKVNSFVPGVNIQVGDLNSDVSAIYEDDQYFYICSSSFPGVTDLLTTEVIEPLADQKHLKLIRKNPTTTTEVYETTTRDVGILVDGSPVFSYKDFDSVKYGKIETINIDSKGNGYEAPPYVLINEQPNKALSTLSGQTVGEITLISEDNYEEDPVIRITSGEGAKLSAVVTEGRITSIKIDNPGRYYSSPPIIRIIDELGKGNFAEYEAILTTDGKIESCKRISGGRFYTRGYVSIFVDPVGKGAQASAKIKRWVKNRYENLKNSLDTNNSYVFENFDISRKYGYGVVANPLVLRKRLNDNLTSAYEQTNTLSHSPIIGYAYDGNPIYGPYGYSDPVNSNSSIARLSSGYQLKNSRQNGPSTTQYPLGSFIDDYTWVPSVQSGKLELDQNNGRFCVTPDYPNGVYAYFLSIDSNNTPVFPYVLGKNYYSLPVDSNYNSKISQDDIPTNVKRLKTVDFEENGAEFVGVIKDVKSGNVARATVYNSLPNFSVNSFVSINDFLTEGSGAEAIVSSVEGKDVVSLESEETKAIQIRIDKIAYLFEGDTITQIDQDGNEASGTLIGDVINDNEFVLRDVSGQFNLTDTISSSTEVLTLILDKNSTFTKGSILTLTDGKGKNNSNIATGEVLEGILRQNSVKIKVISGEFIINSKYFLKSSNLGDTSRSKIISKFSLSKELNIFEIDDKIAILKTDGNHNVAIGDKVNVDILPNDNLTQTTYYVRKRLYQKAILNEVTHTSNIVDKGIGSADILNSGAEYTFSNGYQNVELIFQDSSKARDGLGLPGNPNNARATIEISNLDNLGYGPVRRVIITSKGSGYLPGDVLTVADEDLNRLPNTGNEQRLCVVVAHVGFAATNEVLRLSNINNLSTGDYLKLNEEIVKISSVDIEQRSVRVERGQKGTRPTNHFNGLQVSLFEGNYRFNENYRPFGEQPNTPYIISYDEEKKEIFVSYDYGSTNPVKILQSSIFFDSSTPAKLVTIKTAEEAQFNLEFSKNTEDNLVTNPIIEIQKYYKYKFDVSHFSMANTYLDFSASSNYNIFTEEKFVSNISPGNPGSFVTIKLGFGPNISNNSFTERKRINFSNYFYFIKVSPDVNTNNSFLKIVDDPLIGEKTVSYVTNDKIVYKLSSTPEYDGTGQITYTTSSPFAIGKINSIKITNTGQNYKKLPVVDGVLPSSEYECLVDPIYDTLNNTIVGFDIIQQGLNYSKPKAIVVDSESEYQFKCIQENGKVTSIIVVNGGKFTDKPAVKIIETDLDIFLESDNIGVPQNVSIVNNGYYFNADKTTTSKYKSNTTFLLKDFGDYDFFPGETITQPFTGAKAKVSKNGWRIGSNLLKVEKIEGIFENNYPIFGKDATRTATLIAQISTEFNPDIRSYYDNLGFYSSDKGKVGTNSQKLLDSYFYQDYSYVIKSKTPIQVWKDLIKETTHPAGFQLFGEVLIETDSSITMPSNQKTVETYSVITLAPVNITVIDTRKFVTNTVIKYESLLVERGLGAVSVDTFDSSETLAYNVRLSPDFDGDFDPNTGKVVGTTEFTLINTKNNTPLFLDNPQQIVVTLDGILQEPGKAYTISGTTIKFTQPPFGTRVVEGQEVSPQKFYGRAIKFKNNLLNSRYFKKIKSIANQFDGVKKEFNLYYEDNSIVKTEVNENLIVSLNGVIQNAKSSADTQFGNSYYILRSEDPDVTDKIVFSSAPIDHEDQYDPELPSELKGFEKCFIYTIGNYERFTIENKLIEFRGGGPYLILDEIEKRVRKIDEPLYAFVIIDGVLQREGDSYQIVGPNITFSNPLKKYISESGEVIYQQVSIILAYGRDLPKSLTFYDFQPDTYYNSIELTVNGTGIAQTFGDLYNNLSTDKIILNEGENPLGYIRTYKKLSDDEIVISLLNHNLSDDINLSNPDLKIVNTEELVETIVLIDDVPVLTSDYKEYPIENVDSISYAYNVDSEGNRILKRNISPWLFDLKSGDLAWQENNVLTANLYPGDKIQIDGELDYREILSLPNFVNTRNYNPSEYISNEIYSKVRSTNYEGITRGEGLSVTANVDFEDGSISSLNVSDIDYNKRDLQLYFERGVLLQPTAYQYYTTPKVYFIPVDGNGGGAKAEVIAYGGQILDIVLVDGGSGYTQPPKVVVARGYNRIKQQNRKIDSSTVLNIASSVTITAEYSTTSTITISGAGPAALGIFSLITFGGLVDKKELNRFITQIITPEPKVLATAQKKFNTEILIDSKTLVVEPLKYSASREITSIIDIPADIVSSSTISSIDKEVTLNINKVLNNAIIEIPSDATNDVGAFLDAPLSLTDTIVYIPDTRRFPDASRLLIGKEIVRYARKLSDRFLDVVRGADGTTATTHEAGDYLRHLPDLISIIPVGPTTIFTSEITSTVIPQPTVLIQSISLVADVTIVEEVSREVNTQHNIEISDVNDIDVIKEIIIIPPTSYNVITNIHSTQSYVSTISEAGILNVVNTVDIQMSDTTDKEITAVKSINLELDIITSSSITTEVEHSFSSVTSAFSTSLISSDRLITNIISIDVDNTQLVQSTNISVLAANTLSVVSTLTTILTDPISREIKLDHNLYADNSYIQLSNTINTQLNVPLTVYTLSTLVSTKLAKNADVTRFFKTGTLDYYLETILLTNTIPTRTGQVILEEPINEVLTRNSGIVEVTNKSVEFDEFYSSYYPINAGFNLKTYENNRFVDSGYMSAGTSIEEISFIYPTATINDFIERPNSAITLANQKFNLAIPTIQNPVVLSVLTDLSTTNILTVVGNTSKFPTSGYLFQGSSTQYTVISYTGKTSTSFTGCTVISGSSTIDPGNDIIPYSV